MFYDKKAQLQAKQIAARKRQKKAGDNTDVNIWDSLDPRIQRITESHLRVELRVLRAQLRFLKIDEVRQIDSGQLKAWIGERLQQALADLRRTMPPIPVTGQKITKVLAVGLLRKLGVDLTAGLATRARLRMEAQLRSGFDIERIHQAGLDSNYVQFVNTLTRPDNARLYFGAPSPLRASIFKPALTEE
jgi:hypothetical protein